MRRPTPPRRRKSSEDDDRLDPEEIESRLEAYSLEHRAPTAEELRAAFRRPPAASEEEAAPETFTTRFTTESLFVTMREPASDPDPPADADDDPTVDLVGDDDVIDLTGEHTPIRRNSER